MHRAIATSLATLLATVFVLTALPALSAPKKTRKSPAKAAKKVDLRPTVAVLYFDYTGKDADMALLRKGLAQMVISDLSDIEQVRIVERDRLQDIIAEMKLQKSNRFDKKTAARIGKLLGARYMVLGGYFLLMGSLRVDARVVEVETGIVIKSIGASGKQADFMAIEQKLSAGLAAVLRTKLPKMKLRTAKAAPRKRRKRARPPKSLHTRQAIQYARALDAKDRGDIKLARFEMQKVIKAQPDFELAQLDLASMIQ